MTRPHRFAPKLGTIAAAALLALTAPGPAAAQPTPGAPPAPPPAAPPPAVRAPVAAANPVAARAPAPAPRPALRYEAGTGGVITLPAAAANVFVADPRIAEVRPASATTLFVFGVGPGRTTIAAVDGAGASVAEYDIFVRPAAYASTEAEATIARVMPGTRIRVSPHSRGLMVSGQVASAEEAARAVSIARGFITDGQNIEDQLAVAAPLQVTLRVRIAEMSRSVTRALGVNWQALGSIGRFSLNFLSSSGLAVLGSSNTLRAGTPDANALIDALAGDNLARVLAEPNLTVLSGQSASFLAGGEFPIPVGQQNGAITIEFKKYGVNLAFQPTVLADGKINLKVTPEVSQLTDQGAVRVTSASGLAIVIPALTVRRAETMVELGSGQSFAIAGLLQDNVTQSDSGIPFMGEVPVLGALFRSDDFRRNQTELVILVTPYLVRPVSEPTQLRVAGENYIPPTDRERLLLLRQTGQAPGSPLAPAATPSPVALPAPGRTPGAPLGRPGFILQ
jgi:pilus assembly protein CpaC